MRSIAIHWFAVLAVIISTHNMVVPVKGQCTVKSCESGDSVGSIATEIQDLLMKCHDRLQAIDRRSQEQGIYMKQVQGIHELLNTSRQESETQHDTVLKRFEAIDRRLSELDITIKNETQKSWKPAIAVGIDLARSTVPPIIDNWIVLMHRFNGSLNFSRSWIEYRNGFGDTERGEFWLGNEKIHRLTNRFVYALRIEVQLRANGMWYYADYSNFSLDSENTNYTLRLSGFSGGNAGDSLTDTAKSSTAYHGGMNFSTWDNDNDRWKYNCASSFGGGWWYNRCFQGCLTCRYIDEFYWYSLNQFCRRMKVYFDLRG